MFQTEINLFLQSFHPGWLVSFMRLVTAAGYEEAFVALILIVMFGIDFRKGFILFQLVIWTVIATEFCKHLFSLPRPYWVDIRVKNLENAEANPTAFPELVVKGFLDSLPSNVVAAFRLHASSYGFPSGHVSSTTAAWGGLWLLFRKPVLQWIAPALVLLMALSRMYLGRHFLADVLGGAALGTIVLVAAWQINARRERLLDSHARGLILLAALFLLIPIGMVFVSSEIAGVAGSLVGVNAAYLLTRQDKKLNDTASVPLRAVRVLIAAALFAAVAFLVNAAVHLADLGSDSSLTGFIKGVFPAFLGVRGTVILSRALKLYGRAR